MVPGNKTVRSAKRFEPAADAVRRTLYVTVHLTRNLTRSVVAYQASEPDLIARVIAGDRIAARELNAHSPRVFRLAFRLTEDADLAREFTQETFVPTFGKLGNTAATRAMRPAPG